ncbi:hypothetical protein H7I03_08715 [Mycobacterium sherrisii]|nr:hypothetical protein [Mycobacterium sherrisii]MCV7029276.1 hypothetical protein [Mycobacterium sherrisii]
MCLMSETSETPTTRSATATAPVPAEPVVHRPARVFQAAAWVAIVAGTVFIIAVIFFTGFLLGRSTGHHHGHHHHHKHHAMVHPHRWGGPGGPGGGPIGGPGANQPGGPGSVAPGAPGPSQIPSSVAPSRTP